MRMLSEYTFSALTDNTVTMKLRGGPILHEIVRNFEAHVHPRSKGKKNINKFKLRLYSGHDTTIAGILQVFGVYNYELVPYTGAVMIELYKRSYTANGGYSSAIVQNNTQSTSCIPNTYFIKVCIPFVIHTRLLETIP